MCQAVFVPHTNGLLVHTLKDTIPYRKTVLEKPSKAPHRFAESGRGPVAGSGRGLLFIILRSVMAYGDAVYLDAAVQGNHQAFTAVDVAGFD